MFKLQDLRLGPAAVAAYVAALAGLYLSAGSLLLAAVAVGLVLLGAAISKPGRHQDWQGGNFALALALICIVTLIVGMKAYYSGSARQQVGANQILVIDREDANNAYRAHVSGTGESVYFKSERPLRQGEVVTGKCHLRSKFAKCGHMKTVAAPRPLRRFANQQKDRLGVKLRGTDPAKSGLIRAMSLGDLRGLDPKVKIALKNTSLTHLTAVSGTHVAIVLATIMSLSAPLKRHIRLVLAAALLAVFMFMVGPAPSVVRSGLMAGIGILGKQLGRSGGAFAGLATVTIVLLAIDPLIATDLGFALSVCATAGIILFSGEIAQWTRLPKIFAEPTAVAIAATISSTPVLLLLQDHVAMTALPANLMATPAVALTTLGGLATLFPAADIFGKPLAVAGATWIITVAKLFAHLPFALAPWVRGPIGAIAYVLSSAALCFAGYLHHREKYRWHVAS
ncbi:MAG: ComEC/Rec2 family competence protein [Actinomycetaceae bacterium]|nr:ComEC/Rec2 family competence protein [Actinomycetaceae bacterium]